MAFFMLLALSVVIPDRFSFFIFQSESMFSIISEICSALWSSGKYCLQTVRVELPVSVQVVNSKAHKGFSTTTAAGPQVCCHSKPQTLCQLLLHTCSYLLVQVWYFLFRKVGPAWNLVLWNCLFYEIEQRSATFDTERAI